MGCSLVKEERTFCRAFLPSEIQFYHSVAQLQALFPTPIQLIRSYLFLGWKPIADDNLALDLIAQVRSVWDLS